MKTEQQQHQQSSQQPQEQDPGQKNPKSRLNKNLSGFAKYTGIAFQMLGIILIAVWGGSKLDHITGNKTPVFTIILSLIGVIAAIYIVIKDFIKMK